MLSINNVIIINNNYTFLAMTTSRIETYI